MSLKRDYRGLARIGPGGVKCPCCNPYRDRSLKPKLRRKVRRESKQAVLKAASEQ